MDINRDKQNASALAVTASIISIDDFKMHFHNNLELLLVLEGSIYVGVKGNDYLLEKNDIILINPNEIHSTRNNINTNTLLSIKIQPSFYNKSYANFKDNNYKLNSNTTRNSEKEHIDNIRHIMLQIAWILNKKDQGYEFKAGSYLYLLGETISNNFSSEAISEESELKDNDIDRLQRIINYISKNFNKEITLTDIAENENLNYHYLSRFIKEKLGVTFKEYLNSLRLEKSIRLLLRTNDNITHISNNSGFPNVNSFNTIFKERMKTTPSQFRKNQTSTQTIIVKDDTILDFKNNNMLEILSKYLEQNNLELKENLSKTEQINLEIDNEIKGKPFNKHWDQFVSFGRAQEGLFSNWQRQFKQLQNDVNFDYVRFYSIFEEEMMVYNILDDGSVQYNWTYVDELIDSLLEDNIKLLIELSFMPDYFIKIDKENYRWQGEMPAPTDLDPWVDLVKAFIKHCIDRYGLKEVNSWYFEVWNSPVFENIEWNHKDSNHFDFYSEIAIAINSISPQIKVGAPIISLGVVVNNKWLINFLESVKQVKAPLDFLTIHTFSDYVPTANFERALTIMDTENYPQHLIKNLDKMYNGRNAFVTILEDVTDTVKNLLESKSKIHLLEWDATKDNFCLINDTAYAATYVVDNIISTINKADSFTYRNFSDLNDSYQLGVSHFHGGFGFINKDGIKKARYNAYYLLARLGNKIVKIDDNYIVTKNNDNIQILAYNHAKFTEHFMTGKNKLYLDEDRYSIYEPKPDISLNINIDNIHGNYKISRYQLNRDYGSAFDEWKKIGSPENMSKSEIEYLKSRSYPKNDFEQISLNGKYKESINIPIHGIEMIVLDKTRSK